MLLRLRTAERQSGRIPMNILVVVVGIFLLIALAIGIGASMDTEAQRAAGREAARERRYRNDELRALRKERQRMRDERLRLVERWRRLRGGPPAYGPPEQQVTARFSKQMLAYAGVVVAVCPLLAWLLLAAPSGL
jgi:hypothetical protein